MKQMLFPAVCNMSKPIQDLFTLYNSGFYSPFRPECIITSTKEAKCMSLCIFFSDDLIDSLSQVSFDINKSASTFLLHLYGTFVIQGLRCVSSD